MSVFKTAIILLILSSCLLLAAQANVDTLGTNYLELPNSEKAELLNGMGLGYLNLNDYTKALQYFEQARGLYEQLGDNTGTARALNNIGNIHNSLGNYEKALEYHLESLQIDEQNGNKKGITSSLNNIGIVYQNIGKWDDALNYYNRSLKMNYEIDDLNAASRCLNNIGNIYLSTENYAKSLDFYQQSLGIKEQLDDEYGMATTLNNIGMVLQGLKSYDEAIGFYKRSLDIMLRIEDNDGIASSYFHLGMLNFVLSNNQSSLNYLNKGLRYSILANDLKLQKSSYNILARLYARTGRYEDAYNNFKLYTDIKDELFSVQTNRTITELKIKYETSKMEKEFDLLHQSANLRDIEVKRQKAFIILIIIICIILSGVTIYAYYLYRQKSFSHKIIEDQNWQLEDANVQLKKLTTTDPLTQISNRREITEKIKFEASRFDRNRKPFVFLMCSIVNLKSINERFGSDGGDLTLRTMAGFMRSRLRQQDGVGRWEGNVFLLVLPETSLQGAQIVMQKLKDEIAKFDIVYGRFSIKAAITFGLSVYSKPRNIDDCIKDAEDDLRSKITEVSTDELSFTL